MGKRWERWASWQITQMESEIKWLQQQIKIGVPKKQKKEYEHQIRKKELEIAFNG
jgi:hypothetical protein